MALLKLLTLEAEDMSILYLSARYLLYEPRNRKTLGRGGTYFFNVGRETPARDSSGKALTPSWDCQHMT
jgi:hypothetical protein